jgi:hypothetical protein
MTKVAILPISDVNGEKSYRAIAGTNILLAKLRDKLWML